MAALKKQIKQAYKKCWRLRSCFLNDAYKQKADAFLDEKDRSLFFILGTGRSGTQLITSLLAECSDSIVFHEPNFIEDVNTMEGFRSNPEAVITYWRRFRKYQIYDRWCQASSCSIYGEVNGTIRYHIPGIRDVFPNARLAMISRDGRGVVRSVMGWSQFYSEGSRGAYAIAPQQGDPYYDKWSDMSRFEKVCWGWRETNEYLLEHIGTDNVFKLEGLAGSFSEAGRLFKALGVDVSETSWSAVVNKPSKNASKTYDFPEWDVWEEDQKRSFVEICGDTMEKLGYEI